MVIDLDLHDLRVTAVDLALEGFLRQHSRGTGARRAHRRCVALQGILADHHAAVLAGIIATAIYAFIGAWNEYVYALTFLNSESLLTLPVGLQHFFTEFATTGPA